MSLWHKRAGVSNKLLEPDLGLVVEQPEQSRVFDMFGLQLAVLRYLADNSQPDPRLEIILPAGSRSSSNSY